MIRSERGLTYPQPVLIELSLRPLAARLQVGRWHFRTWPDRFMRLPRGYIQPLDVFIVELTDESGDASLGQIAAFSSEKDAETLRAQLASEGEFVHINTVLVHHRLKDYEWNR
jgi:hypothetical protein